MQNKKGGSKAEFSAGAERPASNKDLNPFTDGLSADRADGQGRAALQARAVTALEDQLDVVIDTDGARDALFHLPVAVLEFFHELLVICGFQARATLDLGAICSKGQGK